MLTREIRDSRQKSCRRVQRGVCRNQKFQSRESAAALGKRDSAAPPDSSRVPTRKTSDLCIYKGQRVMRWIRTSLSFAWHARQSTPPSASRIAKALCAVAIDTSDQGWGERGDHRNLIVNQAESLSIAAQQVRQHGVPDAAVDVTAEQRYTTVSLTHNAAEAALVIELFGSFKDLRHRFEGRVLGPSSGAPAQPPPPGKNITHCSRRGTRGP